MIARPCRDMLLRVFRAFQRAAADGGTVLAQRESGDLRVHATARCIHIQLRVAVLRNSPAFRGLRSAPPPSAAALAPWRSSAARLRHFFGVVGSHPLVRLGLPPPSRAAHPATPRRRQAASLPRGRSARACGEPASPPSLNEPPSPSKPPHLPFRPAFATQPQYSHYLEKSR